MEKRLDFAAFLEAVQNYELGKTEVRTTAHTSSVSVTDFERLQAILDEGE